DGSCTDETGQTLKVQELIEKNAAGKSSARPQFTINNSTIRFLTGDVAVEEGDCETTAVDGSLPTDGHYAALWVRQSGRWKLDSLHETRIHAEAAGDALSALELLVGEWTGQVDKSTLKISAKWGPNKKFLRRTFSTGSGGQPSFSGSQEIGWDPA